LTLLLKFLEVALTDGFCVSFLDVLLHLFTASFVGSHEDAVLPESASAERTIKDFDWLQSHARAYLNENKFLDIILLRELFFVLVEYLICSEPDPVIVKLE